MLLKKNEGLITNEIFSSKEVDNTKLTLCDKQINNDSKSWLTCTGNLSALVMELEQFKRILNRLNVVDITNPLIFFV